MRKVLLATTAITAISLAGVASAQESNMMSAAGNTLNIGGYYEFGFASISDEVEGEDSGKDSYSYGDSELFIDFETTTDAGLTYGVQIDLELVNGNNHGESGDGKNAEESSMYLSDDWGTVHIGHDDNAYGRFQVWAPTFDGSTSQDDNVIGVTRNDDGKSLMLAYTAAGQGQAYEDNAKGVYMSPNFSGFQFGVSAADNDSSKDNATSFGVSYKSDLGQIHRWFRDASLTLKGAAWSNNASEDAKEDHTHTGAQVDWGNWTFTYGTYSGTKPFTAHDKGTNADNFAPTGGGSTTYVDHTDDDFKSVAEMEATEFGVGYQISDAFSFGASLANATTEFEGGTAGTMYEYEGEFQSISGTYTLAPGLKSTVSYNQFDVTGDDDAVTAGTGGEGYGGSNSGTEIVWQIEFSF